ncbi:MAG: hypothetical protein ACRD8W_00230 [Nitrososphaeraceae archaeon]
MIEYSGSFYYGTNTSSSLVAIAIPYYYYYHALNHYRTEFANPKGETKERVLVILIAYTTLFLRADMFVHFVASSINVSTPLSV